LCRSPRLDAAIFLEISKQTLASEEASYKSELKKILPVVELKTMDIRNGRFVPALVIGVAAFLLVGCNSGQQTAPTEAAASTVAPAVPESQQIAEAVLGRQAEVIAHGDLARNGSEQLLVVNRFNSAIGGHTQAGHSSAIFVTRAVIVEKDDGKWTEVLRCDEHLKNTRGYVGGAPAAPVTGWRLVVNPDTGQGLELEFAPAVAGEESSSSNREASGRTISIRWNTKTKRYQSLDQSHKGFLGEVPTLETPQSILK
jgi:hypothetical protein